MGFSEAFLCSVEKYKIKKDTSYDKIVIYKLRLEMGVSWQKVNKRSKEVNKSESNELKVNSSVFLGIKASWLDN